VGQNPVNDALVLYATVRRIDNDPDRPATATADLDIDGKNAFQWCVTRRWAQVIAA
jgi:hypothetical protein